MYQVAFKCVVSWRTPAPKGPGRYIVRIMQTRSPRRKMALSPHIKFSIPPKVSIRSELQVSKTLHRKSFSIPRIMEPRSRKKIGGPPKFNITPKVSRKFPKHCSEKSWTLHSKNYKNSWSSKQNRGAPLCFVFHPCEL